MDQVETHYNYLYTQIYPPSPSGMRKRQPGPGTGGSQASPGGSQCLAQLRWRVWAAALGGKQRRTSASAVGSHHATRVILASHVRDFSNFIELCSHDHSPALEHCQDSCTFYVCGNPHRCRVIFPVDNKDPETCSQLGLAQGHVGSVGAAWGPSCLLRAQGHFPEGQRAGGGTGRG